MRGAARLAGFRHDRFANLRGCSPFFRGEHGTNIQREPVVSTLANQCPRLSRRLPESRAAKQEKQLPKTPLKISVFRSSCRIANKFILSAFPKRTGLNIALLYRRSQEFPAVCSSKERNFNNVCLYGVHVPQGNPNPQKEVV